MKPSNRYEFMETDGLVD